MKLIYLITGRIQAVFGPPPIAVVAIQLVVGMVLLIVSTPAGAGSLLRQLRFRGITILAKYFDDRRSLQYIKRRVGDNR